MLPSIESKHIIPLRKHIARRGLSSEPASSRARRRAAERRESLRAPSCSTWLPFWCESVITLTERFFGLCEASEARRREEKIVEQGWNAQSGSDTDSDPGDEDPHRLTDSQLMNMCRKGDPTLLSLLSISDRVRAEHLLEEAKTDDAATKSAAHVAAGGAQA